jgi:hypothetical protein
MVRCGAPDSNRDPVSSGRHSARTLGRGETISPAAVATIQPDGDLLRPLTEEQVAQQIRLSSAFLRACRRHQRRLMTVLKSADRAGLSEREEELLQQAVLLCCLLQDCPTGSQARERLSHLARRPDSIGLAARQVLGDLPSDSRSTPRGRVRSRPAAGP